MFTFKDDPKCTRFYFVNGFKDGARVRMYATADICDLFDKITEYEKEGLKVTASIKPLTTITKTGRRINCD